MVESVILGFHFVDDLTNKHYVIEFQFLYLFAV